jgi:hypothetical protein
VCTRLRQLADSPDLNSSVTIAFSGGGCLPRLRSFCAWLVRRAGSVQRLKLDLSWNFHDEHAEAGVAGICDVEAAGLVYAALGACGNAGALQALVLSVEAGRIPFSCSSWLTSLRRLALQCNADAQVEIAHSLQPLSELEDLWLCSGGDSAHPLRLGAGIGLPPSLTRLFLTRESSPRLPPQVGMLMVCAAQHCLPAWLQE